ncbi:MAG: hypothetical protein ACPG31_08765 [Planctomycetota bacterium]
MRRSSFVAALAALSLPAAAFGQTQTPTHPKLGPVTTPTPIVYSLEEGVHDLPQTNFRSGPETTFDNTDGLSYYYLVQPVGEEWIDECAFSADDLDGLEQINGFAFDYCSETNPTLAMEVRFYNDTISGAGPTGWPLAQCTYGLTGLPGTFLGLPACWSVTIDLEGGFECTVPQETVPGGFTDFVGVGFQYLNSDNGPILDSLVAAGGGPAVPGYGSQNYFEVFDTSGFVQHAVLGGARAQGSFNLKIFGDGIVDTKVVNPDTPLAGDTLQLKSDAEFRAGNQVTFSLDNAASGTFGLVFASGLAPTPPVIGTNVTLLLDASTMLTPPGLVIMSASPNATYTTPPLPGLPPTVYVQAFEFSGPPFSPGTVIAGSNALKMDN